MNRTGKLALLLWVALLVAGCASPSPSPTPMTRSVIGTLDLLGDAAAVVGETCYGDGGYDDIAAGTQVRVTNQDGTLIGTDSLEEGQPNAARTRCTFRFTVGGLPEATFYTFEVSHRGGLTYSAAEMEAMNWQVAFTLGD